MYKIEKGIPVATGSKKGTSKYPWFEMEVGDSFVVPEGEVQRIRSAAQQHCIRYEPRDFKVRKTDEGVYRCWRLK